MRQRRVMFHALDISKTYMLYVVVKIEEPPSPTDEIEATIEHIKIETVRKAMERTMQ